MKSIIRYGHKAHVGLTVPCSPNLQHSLITYYSVPWVDHFARVRNALIDQIETQAEYFFWIDSDEHLVAMPDIDFKQFDEPILSGAIQFSNEFTPNFRPSCHRNDRGVRWFGAIHEYPRAGDNCAVWRPRIIPGVMVVHDGYQDPALLSEKHRRNLRISTPGLASETPTFGELLTLARHNTHFGAGSALIWLKVLRAAEQHNRLTLKLGDSRSEASAALAYSGYLGPALDLSAQNPLNIEIQLAVLVSKKAFLGELDRERLVVVADCIQLGYFDRNHSFPMKLLHADVRSLQDYVEFEASDLLQSSQHQKNRKGLTVGMTDLYAQDGEVEVEPYKDELLISRGWTQQVLVLTGSGKIFWELLEEPYSGKQLVELMLEAFPVQSQVDASNNVQHFMGDLLSASLIKKVV